MRGSRRSQRLLLAAVGLLAAGVVSARLRQGADGPWDAISREVTLALGMEDEMRHDVISREVTLRLGTPDEAQHDVISREVTLRLVTADLVTSAVSTPPSGLVPSQPVSVSWTLTNEGPVPAQGPWVDLVYFSDDDVIGGDVLAGSFPYDGSLGTAPDQVVRTHTVSLPADPGTYWVVVVANGGNPAMPEEDLADNAAISAASFVIPQTPYPDLVVESVTAPPGGTLSGSTVDVSYVVRNLGPGDSASPFWQDRVYLTTSDLPGTDPTSGTLLGTFANATVLAAGDLYAVTHSVALPHDIQGTFFLAVRSDAQDQLLEVDDANNDAFGPAFTVNLEPQPDLVASAPVGTPATAGAGTIVTVSWDDTNAGAAPTDVGNWRDEVWLSPDTNPSIGTGDRLLGTLTADGVLAGGDPPRPRTLDVALPTDVSGAWNLKVRVDATSLVSELGAGAEANNVAVSTAPVQILANATPDLTALSLLPQGSGPFLAGHPLSVQWTVDDLCTAGWQQGFTWRDRIYYSDDAVLDAGDVALGTFSQSASFDAGQGVWIGTSYSKQTTLVLPASATAGTRWLIVSVDDDAEVYELDCNGGGGPADANNVLAVPITVDVQPTDLAIAPGAGTIAAPTEIPTGGVFVAPFTVTAVGPAGTPGASWTDRVWLSADDVLNPASDVLLVEVPHAGALAAGAAYSETPTASLPALVPGSVWRLVFETDSNDDVAESDETTNNVAPHLFTVLADAPNLDAIGVTGTSTVEAGRPISVAWTVRNTGSAATPGDRWSHRVWLSQDGVPGDPGDVLLGEHLHVGALAAGDSSSEQASFVVPESAAGTHLVLVEVDVFDEVVESDESDNVGASGATVDVGPPQVADLRFLGTISAPTSAVSGQPITVGYTVENAGTAVTSSATWHDTAYLSLDGILDRASDPALGTFTHTAALAPGANEVVSTSFEVPLGLSGNYLLFVETNSDRAVREAGQTADDVAFAPIPIQVTLPPPADLRVLSVTAPPTAVVGDPIVLDWTIENDPLASPASGQWRDALYLSADGQLDASDLLLTEVLDTSGGLAPGAQHTQGTGTPATSPRVPPVPPGSWMVLGRVDSRDQIAESHEDDDVTSSGAPVTITWPTLTLGVPEPLELLEDRPGWFTFTPSAGATVRLTLQHSAPNAWTELYVRRGAPASSSAADFVFDAPGSNQQEILFAPASAETYYVEARVTAHDGGGGAPNATLLFEEPPFALFGASPAVVGAGAVTVELSGSRLDELTGLVLQPTTPGPSYAAVETLVVDPTRVLAAFDLAGAALGDYDVVATASGGGQSTLSAGDAVASGREPRARALAERAQGPGRRGAPAHREPGQRRCRAGPL